MLLLLMLFYHSTRNLTKTENGTRIYGISMRSLTLVLVTLLKDLGLRFIKFLEMFRI